MTKPILVRSDGSIGPTGLKLIEQMASERKSQRSIAVALGLALKAFEKLLDKKGDPAVRLAWESGYAVQEQAIQDKMYAMAFGGPVEADCCEEDGTPILDEDGKQKKVWVMAPVSKAQTIAAMFYTKAKLGWKDSGDDKAIQDNHIQITIPGQLAFGAMLHGLGQKGIADFRKDKTIPLKDVTPRFALQAQDELAKQETDGG